MALPLAARRVAVTRAPEQAAELVARLRALGAETLLCPAIAFAPPDDQAPLDRALRAIGGYDWVIFTSANAVRMLLGRAAAIGIERAAIGGPRLAAVGRSTAAALEAQGLSVAHTPLDQRAEGLLREIGEVAGMRVLIPAADMARSTLADGLSARGAHVDRVIAYRTIAADGARLLVPRLAEAPLDATIFASPSAVESILAGLAQLGVAPGRLGVAVCIGPTTAAAARAAGLPVTEAHDGPSAEGIVRAVVAATSDISPRGAPRAQEDPMNLPQRPRRLRRTPTLRRMVRETQITASDLIAPLFIADGAGVVRPISSMPGHAQRSVDQIDAEIDQLAELGIPAVLLFGIPAHKDGVGSAGWDPRGPVPEAIRAIKRRAPDMIVIADVCLCEYTDHGHCGVLAPEPNMGDVLNDPTLELLARAAVAYAEAGVDIVAPSAMMDGQVAAIRAGLDAAGHAQVPILAYAAKFASAFYGPFREAAESTPQFGDRRAYQMDPANRREAIREVALDVAEGADMLMVKPAGAYLDIISAVRERHDLPLAAYQVSGEFAMIKAAAANGWIDERRAAIESLVAIKRAGADMIITYYAKEVVRWLAQE